MECHASSLHNGGPKIVADGGIRGSGDAFKALLFGADYVMLGGFFAGCEESPNSTEGFVPFFGEASSKAKGDSYVEGAHGLIKVSGTIQGKCNSLKEGLQSALSYANFKSLEELKNNRSSVGYVTVSPNALSENRPHRFL
jgi:IMP dehydrogenase/GMP reductase